MPDMKNYQEISKLHESMYEQSLVFLALRTRPGSEAKLAEMRETILRIYNEIQSLV